MDLLSAPHLDGISIEVTSRCNLRCAYCPKADLAYDALPFVNTDLNDNTLGELYAFCKRNGITWVCISGVGETAIDPGWQERLTPFLDDPDIAVYLISNLARRLTDDDLTALCKLKALQISFDSADPETVRQMRSKARLSIIVDNIGRIKRAIDRADRRPVIIVNCTVNRVNIGHVAGLARLCRDLAVDYLQLGEMTVANPASAKDSLALMTADETATLARDIAEAAHTLADSSTKLEVHPGLKRRIDGGELQGTPCMQPWAMPFIRSDGKVLPCCGASNTEIWVGDLTKQTLDSAWDSASARAVRADLLAGRSKLQCPKCTVAREEPHAMLVADLMRRLS